MAFFDPASTSNIHTLSYDHLKLLTEFTGATNA